MISFCSKKIKELCSSWSPECAAYPQGTLQEPGFLVLAGLQTEREVLTEGLHSIAWSGDHAKTRRPKGHRLCTVERVRSLPVEYGYFVIANPVGVKQSYNSFNKIASSGKERPPRSNYVDCQEYSGLKSSPFLSIALRIVSILCMQATKATFFSFPAASKRS